MRIRILGSVPLTNGSGYESGTLVKVMKKSQNRRNQLFSHYCCLMIEGSGAGSRAASGAGSVLVINGSRCGSGRSKNKRILRIRIPNTCPHTEIYMYHNRGNPSHFLWNHRLVQRCCYITVYFATTASQNRVSVTQTVVSDLLSQLVHVKE
jgi:hypothetical protein